jgi:flagellar motor component MotA
MDEDRMYAVVWGNLFVSIAVVLVAVIATADNVSAVAAFTCAGVVATVGYPCVFLAAWGDAINKVIDSILGIFKRGKKEVN